MHVIGKAREALGNVCGVLDLPPPVLNHSYLSHAHQWYISAKRVAGESMAAAASASVGDRDGHADILVTTYGMWMKRGFTLSYGVQTTMACDTQKMIDVEIELELSLMTMYFYA